MPVAQPGAPKCPPFASLCECNKNHYYYYVLSPPAVHVQSPVSVPRPRTPRPRRRPCAGPPRRDGLRAGKSRVARPRDFF